MNFSAGTLIGRLSEEFSDRLNAIGTEQHLAAGETLCEAGPAFEGAWLVEAGRLRQGMLEGPAQELCRG